MEEQILEEAIEKCMADTATVEDLLEVLNLAQLIIA